MKRRHILTGTAIAGMALTLTPVCGFAQQKTVKEQLVGTWSKVFSEQTYPDGRKEQYISDNPKGISTFDAYGRFSVIFVRSDFSREPSNDGVKPTPEEALAIAKGALSYYGTYTVNEADQTLTLDVEGTSFARTLGLVQTRLITRISDRSFTVRNTKTHAGEQIELIYTRIK